MQRTNDRAAGSTFDFDAQPPTITVAAGYSKHRKRDVLPLATDLAEKARAFIDRRSADVPSIDRKQVLWPGKWYRRAAAILKADLQTVRHEWLNAVRGPERDQRERSTFLAIADEMGAEADFHGLRHSFITGLAAAGVHPKLAQELGPSLVDHAHDGPLHARRLGEHGRGVGLAAELDQGPRIATRPGDGHRLPGQRRTDQ
jgi:integrase